MDLWFRGRREAANRVLNAWLDEAACSFAPTLWDGLAALPVMLSARAAVRAHVTANQDQPDAARAFLAEAARHLAPIEPQLVAIGGLSGTGKSTLARTFAPRFGAAPGAVVLRTDEIRKRLAGVGPLERLPDEAYGPETSERVYGEMFGMSRRLLGAGRSVVLDGVFLRPGERDAAGALAAEADVPFHGVWLEAPPETLQDRLAQRRADASDADAAVLAEQLTQDPGPIDWARHAANDLGLVAERLVVEIGLGI
jgi:hypothetical protein